MENNQRIQKWIECTAKRLQEIDTSLDTPAQKRVRASMNVGYLLGEILAPTFPEDIQTEIQELVKLYQNIGQ